MHIMICFYTFLSVCRCTYMCIYTYIERETHTHAYIYIYMYMHIAMYFYVSLWAALRSSPPRGRRPSCRLPHKHWEERFYAPPPPGSDF